MAGGDSIFGETMSNVDVTRLVRATHSVVAKLDGCFIVLINSWRGYVVAYFKEIVAYINCVCNVVSSCDVFTFERAFCILLEAGT